MHIQPYISRRIFVPTCFHGFVIINFIIIIVIAFITLTESY